MATTTIAATTAPTAASRPTSPTDRTSALFLPKRAPSWRALRLPAQRPQCTERFPVMRRFRLVLVKGCVKAGEGEPQGSGALRNRRKRRRGARAVLGVAVLLARPGAGGVLEHVAC